MKGATLDFGFEGASGELVSINHTLKELHVNLSKENNSYCHNFLFKVKLDQPEMGIKIVIDNAYQSAFQKGWHSYRPFISTDFSKWKRLPEGEFTNGQFSISIEHSYKEFYVTWYPPYSNRMLDEFLSETVKNKDSFEVWRQKIPCIKFGDLNKPTVIIIGRQHPGESMGSFFIEGLIEGLINEQDLTDLSFLIFPIVNAEGTKAGKHRLDMNNLDFNRMWDGDDIPEIELIKSEIIRLPSPKLFIDVHGDEVSKVDYIFYDQIKTDEQKRLFPPIKEELPTLLFLKKQGFAKRFVKSLIYRRKLLLKSGRLAFDFVQSKFNVTAFTLEISAHNTNHDKSRVMGAQFLKGLKKINWRQQNL